MLSYHTPSLRRMMWRASRRLYASARGEISANDMATNGEAYVQSSVLKGTSNAGIEGLTVFDVGANLGAWTRQLFDQTPAARRPSIRVDMFEPVPMTMEKLMKNIAAADYGSAVRARTIALSDTAGEADMVVLSETGGTNSLEFDPNMARGAIAHTRVSKTTVDAYCQAEGIDHIQLLKCDTEGHDAQVLSGARGMLCAGKIDVAQFEYNYRWVYARSFLKDVFDLVDGLPYDVARICPSHIERYDAWHFELERFFEGNYLLVRKPALAWFDVLSGTFDASNTYA